MITGPLKNQIDRLWEEFWTGGITNPLTVIEQISYLMFIRLLDITETRNEKKSAQTKKPFERIYAANQQHLRWSKFRHIEKPEAMVKVVRDEVFPHLRELKAGGFRFSEYMADAQLMILRPSLLVSAVSMIEDLPLTHGDTKGDLYEYVLSKLTTAGINGQFRTPRHIIAFMAALIDPKPTDVIGDPACGTAGFLVGAMEYLQKKYTSPEGLIEGDDGQKLYTGDLLTDDQKAHIQKGMFHGFDFDATMLRIASMNLMLHGVATPDIHYQDTLSTSFPDKFPRQAANAFDVILANPPFKGSLDEEDVHPSLTKVVKTKKTELLFLALILRMLKKGGRSATVVPDGVLFGSSKAHVALRKALVEENHLEAVISLPSGVFRPYAGVSTAIVVFTKAGQTDHVFFHDVQADGYSLDDKREKIKDDDLPSALAAWKKRNPKKDTDRTKKHFVVPVADIRAKDYDLSINRYKETVHEVVEHESPKVILGRLRKLEAEIARELTELEAML
jgi:type I restriction enzyme M protein